MNTVVNSLSELIKTLTDSFRFSAIFPSLFFMLLNWVFIVPQLTPLFPTKDILEQDLWGQAAIISILSVLLGYTINAMEVPIIRVYEGYPWQDSALGNLLINWQQNRLHWLENKIEALEKRRENCYELSEHAPLASYDEEIKSLNTRILKYRSEYDEFPPNKSRILPTELGNIIASFEAYPGACYGMDGVTFWPRLYPILAKEGFLPYVASTRSTTGFLLNTSLLMIAFGIECLLLRILLLPNINWLLPFGAFIVAWVFYITSVSSARDWGATFQTAFDLFRYHLAHALGLKPTESFIQEKLLWVRMTRFWQGNESFYDFNHSLTDWPVTVSKEKEG